MINRLKTLLAFTQDEYNRRNRVLILCMTLCLASGCAAKRETYEHQPNLEKISSQNFKIESSPVQNKLQDSNQKDTDTLLELIIKASAHLTLFTAELFASDAAEKELEKFRTGKHDDLPVLFTVDSAESVELLEGKYYRELTSHLTEQLAEWYGGRIPDCNGLFLQTNSYRVFGGIDFLTEIIDGIDLADIIGSMTYYVRVSTHEGIIYFQGTNVTSFESYSGENYFGFDWVDNPHQGSFRSTTQVFNWKMPIPDQYRQLESVPPVSLKQEVLQ